jgi:hypothetical protein
MAITVSIALALVFASTLSPTGLPGYCSQGCNFTSQYEGHQLYNSSIIQEVFHQAQLLPMEVNVKRPVPMARVKLGHHAQLPIVPWHCLDEHHLMCCDHDRQ